MLPYSRGLCWLSSSRLNAGVTYGVNSLPFIFSGSLCTYSTRGHGLPTLRRRTYSTENGLIRVSEEVQNALQNSQPVVALETTIYTHGFPYPENVALSSHLESLIRVNGGVPATIGILDGVARVGMEAEELIQLVSTAGSQDTWKISRRDLGFIGGLGLMGHKLNGGTTIAGTMILAHLAGIKIFATGGLGGVHQGGENSMDISADLTELGRTPVTVISSGSKSFLDIPRTLEYLETQGVGVGTFADGREGPVDFPAFFSRDSGVRSPKIIADEAEAAVIVYAQSRYPLQSGLLFANPVPASAALAKQEIDIIIKQATDEASSEGIRGSANTPYILKRIRELSGGRSVRANTALIEANVIRGTKVAVELAKLELEDRGILQRPRASSQTIEQVRIETQPSYTAGSMEINGAPFVRDGPAIRQPSMTQVDILVAGSLASDLICDYKPLDGFNGLESPALHTSNPGNISQSVGGVGHNVALAAYYSGATVALASVVADDITGLSLLEEVSKTGMSTDAVLKLPSSSDVRTAQYVAANDATKDLVLAMADMSILSSPELEQKGYWTSAISKHKPKWIVVDANWSPPILASIVGAASAEKTSLAFEPVSTQKAARLFQKSTNAIRPASVVPNNVMSLATPNALELNAMYAAAKEASLFESEQWWQVIDSFGMSSAGSRDKLAAVTGIELVDHGLPQQSIQLLPYIPNIVTKLGSKGCLLTSLLPAGDSRLTDPESTPFILARAHPNGGAVGGLYIRLFPPAERIKQEEVVSVNGVGDTLLGVLMAGLVGGDKRLEDILPVAQQAAVLTLKSPAAVSPKVQGLRKRLRTRTEPLAQAQASS